MARSLRRSIVFVLQSLPAILVLGLLGFVGYWGHQHDWKWLASEPEQGSKSAEEKEDKPPASIDDKPLEQDPFDLTLTQSHHLQRCPYDGVDIPFRDLDHIRRSGVSVRTVEPRHMEKRLSVPASTDFEPSRVARIATRVAGVIWRMEKRVGDTVLPGELLAIVDSLEVGKAKAAYLQAKVQLDVKKETRHAMVAGVVPQISILQADFGIREAEVALDAARQGLLNLGLNLPLESGDKESDKELARRLQFLGLPKEIVETLNGETTGNLLAIYNTLKEPAKVLQRDGSSREPVPALHTLYVVGETNELFIYLDVRQEDARYVQVDMPVEFNQDGDTHYESTGKIDVISSELDPKTRTLRMRAKIKNPDGKLKAKSFGTARIVVVRSENVLAIPENAIQWEGCSHVVFVLEDGKKDGAEHEHPAKKEEEVKKYGENQLTFEVRRVTLGIRDEGYVVVKEGLKAGDRIAVTGSQVLKSYLFRDRIGSGED